MSLELLDDATYALTVNTDRLGDVGEYIYELQAIDDTEDLKSSVEELRLNVTNRCAEQYVGLEPFETNQLVYTLGDETVSVDLIGTKYQSDCPADMQLIFKCGDESCPVESVFTIEEGEAVDSWKLIVETDDKANAGVQEI